MLRRRCRNRAHLHYCRRHGRHHHHHHHHHHHNHPRQPQLPLGIEPGLPLPKFFGGQRTVIAPASRMNHKKTVWEENSPDSLLDICTRYVLNHPQTYCRREDSADVDDEDEDLEDDKQKQHNITLLPDLCLPTEICEKLFAMLHEEGLDVRDETAGIFANTDTARLRSVSVRGSSITDEGLKHLIKHNLRELDLHNCEHLSKSSLELLNRHSDSLVSLNIGNSSHILPDYIYTRKEAEEEEEDSLDEEDRGRVMYDERGYIVRAPLLQRLCVKELFITRGENYMDLLLKPLPRLTHLDLSGLVHNEGLGDFAFLAHLPLLCSLVLHNVLAIDAAVNNIAKMKSLRHLDISQSDEKLGTFSEPNKTLATLVENLPNLASLDISGTNLAGTGAFEAAAAAAGESSSSSGGGGSRNLAGCDIPGLLSRVGSPLEFLGLYKTSHEASCRAQIPAKKISGDSNEPQILVAGMQYLDRPAVLENVLNDLFHIFRYENCGNLKAALDIILLAMDRHPGEKVIQISGSASLYYVVKSEIRANINIKMKKKILATLLNGMFAHKNDSVMMRNGCLTLCQFSIPADVIFDYERLVKILLFIVSEHSAEENSFVQRAGIYLLNSLACQVDGQQKLLVGNLGAMERMLSLIRERVQSGNCDDVMETAWSCMWNVTDETPVNCKRFLDGGGMHLFLQCKEKFPGHQDLLRNMMGLLGNVAEVPALRSCLMTPEFVEEFSFLLTSNSDGIEVSYNAAGVLAHMASDGEESWIIEDPTREEVLKRMVSAIERWNLNTKRNINYRSFEPILRLVKVQHTPQCQHWAVWALANLTTVDAKYCHLVEQEGGLTLLEEILNRNNVQQEQVVSYPRVLELAQIVRDNVTRWKEREAAAPAVANEDSLEFDG